MSGKVNRKVNRDLSTYDKLEDSPSFLSKCQICRKRISKGSPRIVIIKEECKYFYHETCFQSARLENDWSGKPQSANRITSRSDLREALIRFRRETARDMARREGLVFSDTTLHELVQQIPNTKKSLLDIKGIGNKRYERFGESLLLVLNFFDEKYKEDENGTKEDPVILVEVLSAEQVMARKVANAAAKGNVIDIDEEKPSVVSEALVKRINQLENDTRAKRQRIEYLESKIAAISRLL